MELGQIEAFLAAERLGSFTRAAETLDLTQPSISARITGLETEVGGALFARGGRRLRLTPLGKTFLPYAERTLSSIHDGMQAVTRYQEGRLGQVAIASLDTSAMYFLTEPMKRFRLEYPSVDFRITFRKNTSIVEELYSGDVNLGLMGAPLWDTNLKTLAYFQERVRAVVSPEHPLALLQKQRGKVTLKDVYNYTIYRVTLNPHVTAMVEGIAEQARPGSGGAIIYIPSMMVRHLLLEGSGVAFLPEYFLMSRVTLGQLTFIEVDDLPVMTNETLLVTMRGRELDEPSLAFVRMIRAQWRHILVTS